MNNYEYEDDLDILFINNNPNKEATYRSLTIGNIIVDLSQNGSVLSVEIDSASKFFNFPANQLKNLENAKVKVIKFGDYLTLQILVTSKLKEHSFQFAISSEVNESIPVASY